MKLLLNLANNEIKRVDGLTTNESREWSARVLANGRQTHQMTLITLIQ